MSDAARPGAFALMRRGGRTVFAAPDGAPFVPLGINHLDAALEDAGGGARAARLAQMERDLRDWHFNAVGYGAPDEMWGRFPFVAALELTRCQHYLPAGAARYDDVFDPVFQAGVRRAVADLCRVTKGNPLCLGYWWTDTPRWDPEIARRAWGTTWVDQIRALPEGAPGRRRYADFLRGPGPHDDRAFLGLIAREVYGTIASAFAEHDPDRLLFGERYKLGDHPPEVLAEAAKLIDVLSIQPGPEAGPAAGQGDHESVFPAQAFEALHALTGKPVLICDHQVSFRDPAFPRTLWHPCATEAEAGECYGRYLEAAFARPFVVGHFRCQYWSRWLGPPRNLLKQGLRRVDGRAYDGLVARIAAINADLTARLLREAGSGA